MIIVNVKGGLGNQMFQYALGRKLALKNGDVLKLDTRGLIRAQEVGDVKRPFALSSFNLQSVIASEKEVAAIKYPRGFFSKSSRWFRFKILRKMHIGWEPKVLEKKGNIYLDGFWQSPMYFEDIRESLLHDFSLNSSFSEEAQKYADKMSGCNAVSVHVRRGDYAADPYLQKTYGPCSSEYYKKSLETISKQVSNITFFIFSDDIEWVKNNMDFGKNVVYVSGEIISDAEEVILMSLCKHNIIANSTFSWWSAWLNQNANKIVIAPEPWFNTNKKHFKYLIPETWIRVKK